MTKLTNSGLLALYLDYDIDVANPENQDVVGQLIGINRFDGFTLQVFHPRGDVTNWGHLLPVLYGFEDLTKKLPDGRIAAVELAKELLGQEDATYKAKYYSTKQTSGYAKVEVTVRKSGDVYYQMVSIYEYWGVETRYVDDYGAEENADFTTNRAWDILRGLHFAAGLTEEEFVRKPL